MKINKNHSQARSTCDYSQVDMKARGYYPVRLVVDNLRMKSGLRAENCSQAALSVSQIQLAKNASSLQDKACDCSQLLSESKKNIESSACSQAALRGGLYVVQPPESKSSTKHNAKNGEFHPRAKVTDHEVELIRKLHEGLVEGEPAWGYNRLAKAFDLSKRQIGRICRYKQR